MESRKAKKIKKNSAKVARNEESPSLETGRAFLYMAKEVVDSTKNQVLTQAGQAMLAQANQNSQGVLSLLR